MPVIPEYHRTVEILPIITFPLWVAVLVLSRTARRSPGILTILLGFQFGAEFWRDWATRGLVDFWTIISGIGFVFFLWFAFFLLREGRQKGHGAG